MIPYNSYQNISPLERRSPLWRNYCKCEGKTQGKSIRLKSPIDNLRIKNPRWKELSQWTNPKVTDLDMTHADLLHYWLTQGCGNSSYKKKCWGQTCPVEPNFFDKFAPNDASLHGTWSWPPVLERRSTVFILYSAFGGLHLLIGSIL